MRFFFWTRKFLEQQFENHFKRNAACWLRESWSVKSIYTYSIHILHALPINIAIYTSNLPFSQNPTYCKNWKYIKLHLNTQTVAKFLIQCKLIYCWHTVKQAKSFNGNRKIHYLEHVVIFMRLLHWKMIFNAINFQML